MNELNPIKSSDKVMASNIYNAFTLWLTSIFAIPLLVSITFGLILFNYLGKESLEYAILIISLIALIPGTVYACKFINERYYVKNRKKVIEYAALIALFIYVAFVSVQIIVVSNETNVDFLSIISQKEFFLSSIGFLAKIGVFATAASAKLTQD